MEEPVGQGALQVAAREAELLELGHARDLTEEEICWGVVVVFGVGGGGGESVG